MRGITFGFALAIALAIYVEVMVALYADTHRAQPFILPAECHDVAVPRETYSPSRGLHVVTIPIRFCAPQQTLTG